MALEGIYRQTVIMVIISYIAFEAPAAFFASILVLSSFC